MQLMRFCRFVLNFIAENPQNFSQFPPFKIQFSTLDEYFTARAKDIEQREKLQQHQPQQNNQQHPQQPASADSTVVQRPSNTSVIPSPPVLPPGTDFFPFVLPLFTEFFHLTIPSCSYSTCWGWPELGQYHTCVGYWSGYYASRPSIKQVPGPRASPVTPTLLFRIQFKVGIADCVVVVA
jgi:hypothetical protein